MQRSSLLKRLLDVVDCLMTQSKHNSADEILHVGRILQRSTKNSLHPSTRNLSGPQNRITSSAFNHAAVFRVTNKQEAMNIESREIRTHIELARISRKRNRFGESEKF